MIAAVIWQCYNGIGIHVATMFCLGQNAKNELYGTITFLKEVAYMRKSCAYVVIIFVLAFLAGCSSVERTKNETVSTLQNSETAAGAVSGTALLETTFSSMTEGTPVSVTLKQRETSQCYEATLDDYWTTRMPTSAEFRWLEISEEAYANSGSGETCGYQMILAGQHEDKSTWSLTVKSDSDDAVFTSGDSQYYFSGAKDYIYDSDWSAALALRDLYDTLEFEALGGIYETVTIPDDGQGYISAALSGYRELEETHLKVSDGSAFRYSFVQCHVAPAEKETKTFRELGSINENTWAFYANTIFVPENESAQNLSMAGNTVEYSGIDAGIPDAALMYSRVGYITHIEDVWKVNIGGTGW